MQFSGGCEYVLAQSLSSLTKPFAIWVQNSGCGFFDKEACRKTLTVTYGKRSFRLMSKTRVLVDNVDVMLPHTSADGLTFKQASSQMIEMSSDNGISLQWDGNYRIYLKLDPVYKHKVSKICQVWKF